MVQMRKLGQIQPKFYQEELPSQSATKAEDVLTPEIALALP
jgi:hypothetical protein